MEDKQIEHIEKVLDNHLHKHLEQIEISRAKTNNIIKEVIKETVNGKIDRLQIEQKDIKEHIYRIDSKLNGAISKHHEEIEARLRPFELDRVENNLVKKIVFGMVTVLLLAVLTGLVALILK